MAVKLRSRFKLLLAKMQEAETEVAETATAAREALKAFALACDAADKLDDRIGDLLGLRLAYYSDRLEIANSGGSEVDAAEVDEGLKRSAGQARRFVAASRAMKVDKLFRALSVEADDDDGSDDDEPDDDDGSAELESAFGDELESEG
jgi:hypothetical protein